MASRDIGDSIQAALDDLRQYEFPNGSTHVHAIREQVRHPNPDGIAALVIFSCRELVLLHHMVVIDAEALVSNGLS